MTTSTSNDPPLKWHQQRWPARAWREWHKDTPRGMKRFEAMSYIGALVPSLGAAIMWAVAHLNNAVKNEPYQFGIAVLASVFVFNGLLQKRKKDSIDRQTKKDYSRGQFDVFNQWRDSSIILQGGLAMTYRHVEACRQGSTRESGEGAIQQYLASIAVISKELLKDQSELLVSIAVPVQGQQRLMTAKFHMEAPGRHPGRPIPLNTTNKGASKAFREGEAQYISNTQARQLKNLFKGRRYRSFMSFPVRSGYGEGRIVAVVSIDSPNVNGFGADSDATQRDQLGWMIEPALMGIAICLLDDKTFERYRTSTTNTDQGE